MNLSFKAGDLVKVELSDCVDITFKKGKITRIASITSWGTKSERITAIVLNSTMTNMGHYDDMLPIFIKNRQVWVNKENIVSMYKVDAEWFNLDHEPE